MNLTARQNYTSVSELAGVTVVGIQHSTSTAGQVEIYVTLQGSARTAFLRASI